MINHGYVICDFCLICNPVKYFAPTNEVISSTKETEERVVQDLNTVFYSNPASGSSTAQLLSPNNKDSATVLANDNTDSGIAQSNQDNGTVSNISLPSTPKDQSVVIFNLSLFHNEESTDC